MGDRGDDKDDNTDMIRIRDFDFDSLLLSVIVSFSFVNTDLRDIFRSRFPNAEWILIETGQEECNKRINERKGHFYKGDARNMNSTKITTTIKSAENKGDADTTLTET